MDFDFKVQSGAGNSRDLSERVRVSSSRSTIRALEVFLDREVANWEWGPSASFDVASGDLPVFTRLLQILKTAEPLEAVEGIDRGSSLSRYKKIPVDTKSHDWPNTPIGDLVNRAKYKSDRAATYELALRMSEFARFHPRYRVANHVLWPPSSSPLAKRLGQAVASSLGVTGTEAIVRTARTLSKAKALSVDDDETRVRPDEIDLSEWDPEPIVLLVDDVWTTGKTLSALAQACKEQWATSEVYAIIAARTIRGSRR